MLKAVANRAKVKAQDRHTRFKADVNIGIMVSIYNAVNISSEHAPLFRAAPAQNQLFPTAREILIVDTSLTLTKKNRGKSRGRKA